MTKKPAQLGESTKPDARLALLDAAEALFSANGYAAVGTREIAERAGINLGLIQYHFGSKGKLFVATVRRMMERAAEVGYRAVLSDVPKGKPEAAATLARFVQAFMASLLRPEGPQACSVMFREMSCGLSDDPEVSEALLSAVVSEFTGPMQKALADVVAVLKPGAERGDLERCANSIWAQCEFYTTKRPYLERMGGGCIGMDPCFTAACRHIAEFSLRGLGCDERLVRTAIQGVFGTGGVRDPECSGSG